MAELAFHPFRPARKADARDVDGHAATSRAEKTSPLAPAVFSRRAFIPPRNYLSVAGAILDRQAGLVGHRPILSQRFIWPDAGFLVFELRADDGNFLRRTSVPVTFVRAGTDS